MNRRDFLATLDGQLSSLVPAERNDILSDFNEHFETALANGKTEKQICIALGNPIDLASQYVEVKPVAARPKKNTGVIVTMFLGLLFLDAILMIPIIASLFSVVIGLWATILALAITAVALVIASLISFIPTFGLTFLAGLGVCFGGVSIGAFTALGAIGMYYLTKWFFKGCKAYFMIHVKVFQGEF